MKGLQKPLTSYQWQRYVSFLLPQLNTQAALLEDNLVYQVLSTAFFRGKSVVIDIKGVSSILRPQGPLERTQERISKP
jgi:hypothetical protein